MAEDEEMQEDEAEDEKERYQKERKGKGKQPAKRTKQVQKKPRTANPNVVIQEPIQVPFHSGADSGQDSSDDEPYIIYEEELSSEDGASLDKEMGKLERITYAPYRMRLNDELIEEMKRFTDPKLQEAFDDKDEGSKQVKSGKVIHIPSLDELVARNTFFSYLKQIGFEWLGDNDIPDIPVRLAKEFFTTFHFRVTTDLDEVSISFRLYGTEIEMSLTEWTVRLGLCTLEEALSVEWRGRERGIPRRHINFDAQEAWDSLTYKHAGQFQATQSRSHHLSDPILRLVQLYPRYNLLGQSNSAARM